MHDLKIAVATRHCGQPLKRSLETAAMIGARGVQLDVRNELRPGDLSETGRRQFQHQLRERLLTISSFEFPTRRALTDPESLDARVAGLKAALEFAWQLGATVVVGRIGRVPEDVDSDAYQLLVQVLNDIARHSNRVGAVYSLTPTIDSVSSLERLFEDVTDGPLGLNLDPAGLVMAGSDPVAVYRSLYSRVLSVQIRDGVRDIDGQGIEVPTGRGEVVWDELLALLSEGDYKGWLTVTRSSGDDRIGDMGRAIRFLQNVVNGQS